MQHSAVFSFEVDELRRNQLVRINGVRLPEYIAIATCAAEGKPWRSHGGGEMVNVILTTWSEARLVCAWLSFAQHLKVAAVKLHATEMTLAGVVYVGGYKQGATVLVNSLNIKNFKIAFCNLVLQSGFRGKRIVLIKPVEIKVGVAVAPA